MAEEGVSRERAKKKRGKKEGGGSGTGVGIIDIQAKEVQKNHLSIEIVRAGDKIEYQSFPEEQTLELYSGVLKKVTRASTCVQPDF